MEKALSWQMQLENTEEIVNNHKYIGPHKWIVCLIGSDSYTVQDFILKHKPTITKRPTNLSISIMGLSGESLDMHTSDYKNLASMTREGEFLNIVAKDKDKADSLANQFFGAMNVYSSKDAPIVREHF